MTWSWYREPWYKEDGWQPQERAVPYFEAALVFASLVYAFETYLDLRQYQKLKEPTFPAALADAIRGLGDYTGKAKKKEDKEAQEEEQQEKEEQDKRKKQTRKRK